MNNERDSLSGSDLNKSMFLNILLTIKKDSDLKTL